MLGAGSSPGAAWPRLDDISCFGLASPGFTLFGVRGATFSERGACWELTRSSGGTSPGRPPSPQSCAKSFDRLFCLRQRPRTPCKWAVHSAIMEARPATR